MNTKAMVDTAKALVAGDKGLLAMDESSPTCNNRFAVLGIPRTEETRRAYRELIVTTPGLGDCISGAILYDETIRQQTIDGRPFARAVIDAGIIPGIKVDMGAKALAGYPGERVTEGLDGLRERLAEYAQMGARFAKWRAVISIGDRIPSQGCIDANAHALARYAALCQEAGLVPAVEPEVLMDGDHTMERCFEVTKEVLRTVFHQLHMQRVALDRMILKPNMVLPGLTCPKQESVDQVADATVRCLLEAVPAAVPGVAFLSGGQPCELATDRLQAMNYWFQSTAPWALTFSFARAIQQPAMEIWKGDDANVTAAQQALYHRACCNRDARRADRTLDQAPHGSVPDPLPRGLDAGPTKGMEAVGEITTTAHFSTESSPVLDIDGQRIGWRRRSIRTEDGELILIAREERFGGGAIVVPWRQLACKNGEDECRLSYSEMSIREAPQYSQNVDLHAYFEFWKRLGARNSNMSMEEYVPTGGGAVQSDVDLPDDLLREEVIAALADTPERSVNTHLATVSVRHGTVLLDGYQNTTEGRLAAAQAAASVAGVKEIVNMLVIRAL